MGTFYEGDRVRLGRVRGGIVVKVDGVLRVQFPPSKKLLWLDYVVPDEGHDGPIYPNEWHACDGCGNPSPSWCCTNCARRQAQRDTATFIPNRVHVASSVRRHGRTIEQRCARCGGVLTRYVGDCLVGVFEEGALVEHGSIGLVARPGLTAPTCRPVRERVSA